MPSPALTARLKALILPPRPDPARSRRIAEGRLLVSAVIVLGVFSAIAVRVLMLASEDNPRLTPYLADGSSVARGEVFDRNGRLLATNLPIVVLHADPAQIMDAKAAAQALAPMLPRYDEADLLRLLTRKTRYVELDRKLTPARHAAILQLGIPGIHFRKSVVRAYPGGDLAAHVLGHVDVDNNGIAGVEKSLNTRLAAGENITLSIDSGVQAIVARALQAQIDDYEALAGAALIISPDNANSIARFTARKTHPEKRIGGYRCAPMTLHDRLITMEHRHLGNKVRRDGVPRLILAHTGFHRMAHQGLHLCDVALFLGANLDSTCHGVLLNRRIRRG